MLCELASATEESAVDAVAAALAIEGRPAGGLAERLVTVLADTELVLLLDNCEHVLDAVAALVDRLLAGCPNVLIVATSQERLRVAGEQVRRVRRCRRPVTAVRPSSCSSTAPVPWRRASSQVPASWRRSSTSCAASTGCRWPSSWPRRASTRSRLPRSPPGSTTASTCCRPAIGTASRHGSLAAAMSWSLDQLDPRLQLVFADLSVFTVAFTTTHAAAICGLDLNAARADLDQLVERSLVMRAPPRRFMLLETLRAFGAEQRAASGRVDIAAERHAHHQVAWIEAADRRMLEPGADVVPEIDAAIPELRAALGWLLEHHRIELAGRLVNAIVDYGLMRLRPDVLAWAERVAEADPEDASPVAPVVWAVSAYAAWMAGDAGAHVARGRRALRSPSDPATAFRARWR